MEQGRNPKRASEPIVLNGWYDIWRRDELLAVLDRVDPTDVVVLDLSLVEHLDCACLGILIRKLNQWREKTPNVELRLDNVGAHLQKMIKLLRLDQALKCSSSLRAVK